MSRELKRGLVRILTNYTRLLSTLALGIAVVPLTIHWLGDHAFGLISLLGANIGLAGIFRQIIQRSLVRELGQAYHADDQTFAKSYAAIGQVAVACALFSMVSFAIMIAVLPFFKIPPEFLVPARWFIVGQGLHASATIVLAPMLNMYLVKEKFIGYNIWYVGVRASNILSVLLLGYVIVIDDPALGLTLHGITWGAFSILGMIIASFYIVSKDHRLVPRYTGSDKESRSQVLSTFSWNTAVQVAMNLHEQLPPLLLNLFSGTLANAAWGIGFRLVAYIRMVTTGIQFGSDAVSARIASGEDSDKARTQLQRLVNIQTKLTAMTALPAAVGVFIYAFPIFHLWVGSQLNDYDAVMRPAVIIARILSLALLARAVSDTWIIILYGAGHVHRYAKLIIIGGVIAPSSSIFLMFLLPDNLKIYAPPAMFTTIFATFHLIGIPIITGRCLHLSASKLIFSLTRPVIAMLVAVVPAMLYLSSQSQLQSLGFNTPITKDSAQAIDMLSILISIIIMAIVYAAVSFAIVLNAQERARIFGLLASIKSRFI